jgi:hypothetical protein
MRFSILLALLLAVASAEGVQTALNSAPYNTSTTTATLTTIYPFGPSSYCGVASVGLQFVGPFRISFGSTVPMDFYIFQSLNYIPCGEHLTIEDLASDGCIFAKWNATSLEVDENLTADSQYFIFLVAWGEAQTINGATATIAINGTAQTHSTTQVSLTPNSSNLSASNSLQMPRPPESATLQTSLSNNSSSLISETAVPLLIVAAIGLYLLVRRRFRQAGS